MFFFLFAFERFLLWEREEGVCFFWQNSDDELVHAAMWDAGFIQLDE